MFRLVHTTLTPTFEPRPSRVGRRRHHRRSVAFEVTAVRCGHDVAAYRRPICPLAVRDISEGGLAATANVPLEIDEPVTLQFAPHGSEAGFDLRGHVTRCEPAGGVSAKDRAAAYEVAIRFDPFSAA